MRTREKPEGSLEKERYNVPDRKGRMSQGPGQREASRVVPRDRVHGGGSGER